MDHSDEIERLKELYTHEYPLESGDINYIWHPRNPVSIYYRQAQERALVSMFNAARAAAQQATSVGCRQRLRRLSPFPGKSGVPAIAPLRRRSDPWAPARRPAPGIQHDPVCRRQCPVSAFPGCLLRPQSPSSPYSLSILDPGLRRQIAEEITRLLGEGGYLLWYDMSYTRSVHTQPVSLAQVFELFPLFQLRLPPANSFTLDLAPGNALIHAMLSDRPSTAAAQDPQSLLVHKKSRLKP